MNFIDWLTNDDLKDEVKAEKARVKAHEDGDKQMIADLKDSVNLLLSLVLLSNFFGNAANDYKIDDTLGNQWFYSTTQPVYESDKEISAGKFIITGGTGWTPGKYTILTCITHHDTGADSFQNVLALTTSPAPDSSTGGIGYHALGGQPWNKGVGGQAVDDMITDAPAEVDVLYSNTPHGYVLVTKGDSLTQGHYGGAGQVDYADSYPNQLFAMFDATELTHSWVVFLGGTNDLHNSVAAATVITRIQTFCAGRKAAGFKVLVMSILPRSDAGNPGGFEAARATVNAALRADFNVATTDARIFKPAAGITYADGFADIAANNVIGDAGDELNTTYYQADQCHMKPAGYTYLATDAYNGLIILDAIAPANHSGDFFSLFAPTERDPIWHKNYFRFDYQEAA